MWTVQSARSTLMRVYQYQYSRFLRPQDSGCGIVYGLGRSTCWVGHVVARAYRVVKRSKRLGPMLRSERFMVVRQPQYPAPTRTPLGKHVSPWEYSFYVLPEDSVFLQRHVYHSNSRKKDMR
jgi:hypothetical protein